MDTKDVREQIRAVKADRQELFGKYMRGFEAQVAAIKLQASMDAVIAAKSKAVKKALDYKPAQ